MESEEISKLFRELDQRYITKDELFMLTDARYAKRDEFAELRGKVEAVQTMQAKSAELLEDIHSTTSKIREENAMQTVKLEATEKELKKLEESTISKVLFSDGALPRLLRFSIAMLIQLAVLYLLSVTVPHKVDMFIKDNGFYVTMFGLATSSIASSWKGGSGNG